MKVNQRRAENITGRCILAGQYYRKQRVAWCGQRKTAYGKVEGLKQMYRQQPDPNDLSAGVFELDCTFIAI